MDGEVDWKVLALEKQLQFFETLGSRPYDEIEKSNMFLLKKKVGYATCGKPSELPESSNYYTGYSLKNLECINPICLKIVEKSDYDPIKFCCVVLILFHKGETSEMSVFKISTKIGNIFLDSNCRVYDNWESFMKNNKLPACEYCFPANGDYHDNNNKEVFFAVSPACSITSRATDCLDTVGAVAGVGAAAVFAAGMVVTVAPVAVATAGTTTLVTAAYSVARNTQTLYDRKKHDQSIGLRDRESRLAWLSIASSAVGAATFKALSQVQKAGKPLTKMAASCLHAMNATSVFFSGFGFVESLIICHDKHKEGTLTKKDIFDLSCELLFLFNALASAKATSQLVNNMSVAYAEAPQAQRKLTKTQKRNLQKRAAKRRAKGLTPVVRETEKGSNFITPVQVLLAEAVRYYAPRIEAINLAYQTIAHDVTCWKRNEITEFQLLQNMITLFIKLHDKFKEEINEVSEKVMKFFNSIKFQEIISHFWKLFKNASEELKTIFCTKVINTEDQFEKMINEAEEEITELRNSLGLQENVESSENIFRDLDISDDDVDGLDQETQTFLSSCCELIEKNSWTCDDITDFGEILDGVKFNVVSEFKEKLSSYKKSLEAAKSASGTSFDIDAYHKALKIKGDVSQHIFSEILQKISASDSNVVYKIKTKCQEMKKVRRSRTTPVWEALTSGGIYHFYGPHGTGYLDKEAILEIVSDIILNHVGLHCSFEDCRWINNTNQEAGDNLQGVFMIETKCATNSHIVVYQNVTKDNTAFGMITVVS